MPADKPAKPRTRPTRRQEEVLALLGEGMTDKEIAAALGFKPRTSRAHVQTLKRKFAVSSRRQLIPISYTYFSSGVMVPKKRMPK